MSLVTTMSSADESDLLSLIASLAIEDVQGFQDNGSTFSNGKAKESDVMTDEELAVQLYAEEANGLLIFAQDAALARSIDVALRSDRATIRQIIQEESAAIQDRRMALALSPGQNNAPVDETIRAEHELASQSIDDSSSEEEQEQESGTASSSQVTAVPPRRPRELHECVICTDAIRGVEIEAPCGHYYDVQCLVDLFRSTIRDESLFPPRCCQQPFVFHNIRRYLSIEVATQFQQKAIEFSTPDRVYCYRSTCSRFLGPATNHAAALRCTRCFASTCGHCKEAAHSTDRLCSSELDSTVLALAEREGWKRCPGCQRLVELTVGCFHMTCRCKKQFCYLCTETWKNCSCPQWDENRLVAVAEDRVNREIRAEPAARPAAQILDLRARIAHMAERLREDHNCQHDLWSYRSGGGRCEVCNFMLPQFLLRCRGCQMLACVRCRRNRL